MDKLIRSERNHAFHAVPGEVSVRGNRSGKGLLSVLVLYKDKEFEELLHTPPFLPGPPLQGAVNFLRLHQGGEVREQHA